MAALTQVISAVVNHDRSTEHRLGAKQLDEQVLLGTFGNTLGVRDNVSQVTNVSLVVLWGAVVLGERVEVGAGGSAAVGVVTKGVDVETSQGVGIVSGDLPRDNGGLGFGGLLESNDTGDLLVSSENCNCRVLITIFLCHFIACSVCSVCQRGVYVCSSNCTNW